MRVITEEDVPQLFAEWLREHDCFEFYVDAVTNDIFYYPPSDWIVYAFSWDDSIKGTYFWENIHWDWVAYYESL